MRDVGVLYDSALHVITSNADTGSRVRNDLFLCTLLDEIGKILSK